MAGVSTKEIKNRIRSMESTKQITKAMEMVAASKLRKTQDQANRVRPYYQTLYSTIQSIAGSAVEDLPYLDERVGKKTLYVVIAGDRGLAGGYNSNIFKLCHSQMDDAAVVPIGRKAGEFFRTRQTPLCLDSFPVAEAMGASDCFTLAKQLCKLYRERSFDRIVVGYTEFVSVLSQTPEVLQLLPLQRPEKTEQHHEMLYEPGATEVLEAIIPEYIGGVIYGALCESLASEQAARRTAMDSATQNAEEMIADLSLKFNRARQAAITQEITEIVAGG